MSRVGKRPIPIPSGVTVQISPDAVEVKGPKGTLRQPLPPGIVFEMNDGNLEARPERDDRALSKFHGLARTLVANAVTGVSDGFKKELDIVGIGYRAEVVGQRLTFALGFSHPVLFDIPAGITVTVDKQTHLVVSGVDRQAVGQVAANIRGLRKPDPYKQKGIRYTGETLRKKVGKTGA
jgi:large subunit ribosomal protein L6